ncbi:O-antigen polysaccharide polymerase Wzy [Anaeromyxobacter terrae]|uniref:O-antigen polysaccharide polymerase Wzy n=1 Tax=Anaeromyxobacter terrae TaxID=2925406 RepID=UPI001F57DEF6|nr:O-antigen polysaccharide polymerase Wzy [Anaeromyxobacter sp. SG22]
MTAPLRVLALTVLLAATLVLPSAGGPLGAALIWSLCLSMLVRSRPSGWLSLASLYLLVLGIFHLGLIVPDALGISTEDAPQWAHSSQLGAALGLFSIASIAFTLGAGAYTRVPLEEDAAPLPPQRALFWMGVLVAVCGAAMLWAGVLKLGLLSLGYSAHFERAMMEDVRFFGFGLMLFPMGVLVGAVGATQRQMLALGGMLAVVLGPLFLGGFRGPAIVQATALLAVWARKDRRIARRLAITGTVVAIVLIPAIGVTRDAAEGLSVGLAKFRPLAVLRETGGSLYPLVVTTERVRLGSEKPWMGRSYFMSVQRIVPNISRRWTPPSGQRTLTPSTWATMHADSWAYEHGGGIGFSGVAEPYLNFGVAGVVIFFLLLGFVIQRWDRWLARDPFRAAIGAASFGTVLWTVRNDAMELFRVLVFASATVLAAWLATRIWARR